MRLLCREMQRKGWQSIIPVGKHRLSVTGLSVILCEILCQSFQGHTFFVFGCFCSRVVIVVSTAYAVAKGEKENATWIPSFSADAVFGAFHSSNAHQQQWHRCLMDVSVRFILDASKLAFKSAVLNGLWNFCYDLLNSCQLLKMQFVG